MGLKNSHEREVGHKPSAASIGIMGDSSNVDAAGKGGVVLMGGSTDVDAAFKWMIEQAGEGDFVVIRSTGTDAYNPYIFGMGGINSVETLKIDSFALANDSAVVETIRQAEALFIAGGDQSDYVRYWKGTKTADAINYLINTKKVPVGGTSAGCAILGEISFSALNGTITSEEALVNPYDERITLQKEGFLTVPFLKNTITDQHYLARKRVGRHIVFMGRAAADTDNQIRGIGVDEKTAVVIDSSGMATILGESKALFLEEKDASKDPEILEEDKPLTWNLNNRALTAYSVSKGVGEEPQFDIVNWVPLSDAIMPYYYFIEAGELSSSAE